LRIGLPLRRFRLVLVVLLANRVVGVGLQDDGFQKEAKLILAPRDRPVNRRGVFAQADA
jgi:hypothetical protein